MNDGILYQKAIRIAHIRHKLAYSFRYRQIGSDLDPGDIDREMRS